jgi:hypothetical protein
MAKKKTYLGNMLTTGVGNMVGVGLISGTSSMVNTLPAGSMERSVAGIVPGLQSVAMLGPNVKFVNDSLGGLSSSRKKVHKKRK